MPLGIGPAPEGLTRVPSAIGIALSDNVGRIPIFQNFFLYWQLNLLRGRLDPTNA